MNKYYLLDCTLRDGGYLNDWKFGKENIAYIFNRLVSSRVDVIEVGFLDDRRPFREDSTINPDTESYDKVYAGLDHGNAMVVGMIDFGTCKIENLKPCAQSCLDGIRVIFKKEKMYPAMEFCRQVKALGYKVFSQLVSITSYNDEELKEVIQLVNDVHPYAVSMVDTYGLCDALTLSHIVDVIDVNLDSDICLGYHAHNNFQLGYSNAISVLNKKLERDVLVDGTLYGMGKSAGNAPLELLAMYMNLNFDTNYDLGQIQEAISTCILDLYRKRPWGYTLFYFIAASNRCHPDYVSFLMNKRTLSITAINEILSQIPEEKKLGKDIKMLEKLYLEYQMRECDDTEALQLLRQSFMNRKILMVGPGRSVQIQQREIECYIQKSNPIVIAVNYFPKSISADYLFLTNSRRYLQMSSSLAECRVCLPKKIATSNLSGTENDFDYIVNFSSLIDENEEFPDNSMKMLARLLIKVGCKHIALAGFDGYTVDNINYYDANMEYDFVKQKATSLNESAKQFFSNIVHQTEISFITESQYRE